MLKIKHCFWLSFEIVIKAFKVGMPSLNLADYCGGFRSGESMPYRALR